MIDKYQQVISWHLPIRVPYILKTVVFVLPLFSCNSCPGSHWLVFIILEKNESVSIFITGRNVFYKIISAHSKPFNIPKTVLESLPKFGKLLPQQVQATGDQLGIEAEFLAY